VNKHIILIATFMLAMSLAFIISSTKGCAHVEKLGPALSSVGGCALHTTLSCVTRAGGDCPPPSDMWGKDDWREYGTCLSDRSSSCSLNGLAGCLYRSLARATGVRVSRPSLSSGIGPSARVAFEVEGSIENEVTRGRIDACLGIAEITTEDEAIAAVAACQRKACIGMGK
jgi:hypothetical protein